MNRRSMMLMLGIGAMAAATPLPKAGAHPSSPRTPPMPAPAAPPGATTGGYLFHDEFDGPAGSAPNPANWTVATHRTPIKNPVGWDRPEFFYQYRDDRRNVFVDGNSNLVLRATKDGDTYYGGLVSGNWRGPIGTTWEARIKLNCLTAGCWPAWWLSNDDPGRSSEVDLLEWYGNGEWPSGTTVHANPEGTAFETHPIGVDGGWHTWRCRWDQNGFYFWEDYVDGAEPYFTVPATGIEHLELPIREWPFNEPGYTMFPVLNLAVGGSGGGDARQGSYPADMLIDWVRVW
ncbi:MAG TPA: glycoside hydrolase family 16 protein [Mycobacterium sp.]|uniref:glycoside hydrolase family 16 protein n=1 Tax=Mycobacterium sp. TaxID=1785 RepID=UPI002D5111B8|nr:glycoside hydrolase family 16 protein [Mycobacterium sp.]HZU49451.1 glycoside hydrolase family 16 protein [Mycobacterium sp.]